MTRSTTKLQIRRAELEARIEELVALLDLIDGDENLEDNGDLEPSFGWLSTSAAGSNMILRRITPTPSPFSAGLNTSLSTTAIRTSVTTNSGR